MKNEYEICGATTKIYLQRKIGLALVTLIDTDDLPIIQNMNLRWFATWSKRTQSFYAQASVYKNGRRTSVRLHRIILGTKNELQVDHLFHDTLDNRKNNLREVNNSLNAHNRKGLSKNNTAGIQGVYWNKQRGKWHARIMIDNKRVHLGLFGDKVDAAKAYNKAAIKYIGEYTNLNVI